VARFAKLLAVPPPALQEGLYLWYFYVAFAAHESLLTYFSQLPGDSLQLFFCKTGMAMAASSFPEA
jgi:hypothetical protein